MSQISALPFLPPASNGLAAPARDKASSRYPKWVGDVRRFFHGVGSALLIFTGASSMTSSSVTGETVQASLASADMSSLPDIFNAMLNSQFAGPVQIGAAVLLFLAAGQCIARFVGLAVAAVVIFMHLNNLSPQDLLVFLQNFAERSGAAIHAFQTADVG